jgi:hypothetical protein
VHAPVSPNEGTYNYLEGSEGSDLEKIEELLLHMGLDERKRSELKEIYWRQAQLLVPGQSYWPQNLPFDTNLAPRFAGNTCFRGKFTTYKTSQSADLFVYEL